MRRSTVENLKITASGIASAIVFFLAIVVLAHYRTDWEKWLGIGWWTAVVFGLVAYFNFDDLKRTKCLLVFSSALLLHLYLIIHYYPSNSGSLTQFYLLFTPVEMAAVLALMYTLGGARLGRGRGHRAGRRKVGSRQEISGSSEVSHFSDDPGPDA